jgi:hypothetical protein
VRLFIHVALPKAPQNLLCISWIWRQSITCIDMSNYRHRIRTYCVQRCFFCLARRLNNSHPMKKQENSKCATAKRPCIIGSAGDGEHWTGFEPFGSVVFQLPSTIDRSGHAIDRDVCIWSPSQILSEHESSHCKSKVRIRENTRHSSFSNCQSSQTLHLHKHDPGHRTQTELHVL